MEPSSSCSAAEPKQQPGLTEKSTAEQLNEGSTQGPATENNNKSFETDSELLLAATLVQDAVAGRNMAFKTDLSSLRIYKLYNHMSWKVMLYISIWGNLLLALCEKPAVEVLALPYWSTMILEALFLLFFLVRFLHYAYFTKTAHLWKDPKNIAILATILLTTIDMFVYVLWVNLAPSDMAAKAVRWSRPLRVLYLINFPEGRQLRKAFRNMRRTLPDILHVLVLFFSSIAMFALLALKLMQTRDLFYPRGTPYFRSYWECLWDLYVLVTTANNPDVMMPAYDNDNWFALFFVIYLMINLYIFMNIVLAVVYNNYKKHLKNEVKATVYMKRQLLSRAFDLLKTWECGHYVVSKQKWQQLMRMVAPNKSETQLDLLLFVLDDDGDNNIQKKEFLKVADLLAIDLTEEKDEEHIWQKLCPTVYYSAVSEFVKKVVNLWFFQHIFDVLILLNAICIGLNWEEAEYFFLPAFSLEILLKIYALGPKAFFYSAWNIFDFVVVFAAVVATIVFSALDFENRRITVLDVLLVLRVLRLVRLVGMFERFQVVLTTIVNIGPSIATYGAVIFVIYYIYAILGMEIFSGMVRYYGYDNLTETELFCGNAKLEDSEFYSKHYCNNNFDNILHAFVLLFELMVVNQWQVLTSGFVLVTNKAARLYFISFHMVCVLILLNILTAFILEVFILEYNLSKTTLVSTIEARIKDMGLGIGQSPAGRRPVKQDKQVLVDSMETAGDRPEDIEARRRSSTEVIDMSADQTPSGLESESGLRFRLKINARKKVVTLLEHMFEGEIKPLDEGLDDTGSPADTGASGLTVQDKYKKKLSLDTVT